MTSTRRRTWPAGSKRSSRARLPSRAGARIPSTTALAGIGLADDRLGRRGEAELWTRQVTLIQAEHLPVIAQVARVDAVDPVRLRRVSGGSIRVGDAVRAGEGAASA